MLSRGDAAVVEREHGLPGLATLLDPERFAALMAAAAPEAGVRAARALYLRYKPRTSCLAAFELATADGDVHVYARAHPSGLREKLRKAAGRAAEAGPLGPGIRTFDDLAIALFTFPNDHELRALRRFSNPRGRARIVRRAAPEARRVARASLTAVRYKPERRFVGRLDAGGRPRAAAKLYCRARFRPALANARAFESSGPLRLPRLLGSDEESRLLLFEWVKGTPLLDRLAEGEGAAGAGGAAGVAAALATLHRHAAACARHYTPCALLAALARSAAAVGALNADRGGRAVALAQRLAPAIESFSAETCCLHGDLSAEQIVVHHGEPVILDLDRAGAGPAALDLGSFAANLEYHALLGRLPRAVALDWSDALARAYRDAGGAAGHSAFTAAALLLLAAEPFRRRVADWPERIDALLDRVDEIAHGR